MRAAATRRPRARALLGALALAAASALPAALATPAAARSLPGLQTGFTDDSAFASLNPEVRARWLGRAVAEHASTIRLDAQWAAIAPSRPPTEALAGSPSWPGYDFAKLDEAVRDASARRLRILITVTTAPRWAEGSHRPADAALGSWKPNAAAFAAFARAIATRYDGSFTPPGASAPLPEVRFWQAWNEPNLSIYLEPQWHRAGHGWSAASPGIYRGLLDAFYGAVHRVHRGERVLSAGTAPYGDPPGGSRMPPARFVRDLLCLTPTLQPVRCAQHADFDILDHHPYSVAGPHFHALNRDDVAIADMGKLIRPLRAAERLHLVGGPRHHPVWVTEVSWDSDPPDPQGVPAMRQAHWLQTSLYLLWRQGVSTVLWYLIVDAPPIPSYATTYQSGVYLLNGRPKPSATAFRFPFVLADGGRPHRGAGSQRGALLWGKSPFGNAPVQIQRRSGHAWRALATVRPTPEGIFEARVAVTGHPLLRAAARRSHSLPLRG